VISPESDWSFWRWVLGLAGSALAGLLGGVWFSRGVLKDLEHADKQQSIARETLEVAHNARLITLENFKAQQEAFCARQKAELVDLLQREICSIVRAAIKDLTIEQNEKLSKISTSIAVQASVSSGIKADLADISQRMNQRRKGDPGH
jgi:hypothetical protein